MIYIEDTVLPSDDQWEAVVHGVRNPYASWDREDSKWVSTVQPSDAFQIGEKDLELMAKLSKAGNDHGKFMRMLPVICSISAPVYFLAELDTYKIGTTRNSTSLMHSAMKDPYTIRNFSVPEELYEILDPIIEERKHPLVYDENHNTEYKLYVVGDREYKVFENGRVIRCAYSCQHTVDNRIQHFDERECKPSQNPEGYYYLNLGGHRFHERWLLHRLVAEVWLKDTYAPGLEINHKDGNKGNNSVQNLEWVTREENTKHKFEFLGSGRNLHSNYLSWKKSTKYSKCVKESIELMRSLGASYAEIQQVHELSKTAINSILNNKKCENAELFELAEYWENTLGELNELRDLYLETKDDAYFFLLRKIMPMNYNYTITWSANYQVLKSIYHARKNHKLEEWHIFCDWIKTLPYARELITYEE